MSAAPAPDIPAPDVIDAGPGRAGVEMAGISKVFGGIRALDDVSFSVKAGEVPGFNRSSQHQREPIAAPGQRPLRAFSSQGSCAAWC